MSEARHHPLSLKYVKIVDIPPKPQCDTVTDVWNSIQKRLEAKGSKNISNLRVMFAAGIYAASRDVLMNRADSRSLSEAAARLENAVLDRKVV